MRTISALALVLAAILFAPADAEQSPAPPPTVTSSPAPTSGSAATAGTVTSVLDPAVQPKGRYLLHGITKDPKDGSLITSVSRFGNREIIGPYLDVYIHPNDDVVVRIPAAGRIVPLSGFPYPNAMVFNSRDGMLYVAAGTIWCPDPLALSLTNVLYYDHDAGTHCEGTKGVIAVDPVTGSHHDFVGQTTGYADGIGVQARFSGASGITYDPDDGNLYVTDTYNHRIRRITMEGSVSSLAGLGKPGHADGPGAEASFNRPRGIVYCLADKSFYVADTSNNEIRKVTTEGVVSTFAGAPQTGYMDGPGVSARFDHPGGVACDSAGNIYVADTYNNMIRLISPAGIVSTLAGSKEAGVADGAASVARFNKPTDLWFDATNNILYVIDAGSNQIRKVTTIAL
jgi:DNA-binding beta-propeller fold protein YncE